MRKIVSMIMTAVLFMSMAVNAQVKIEVALPDTIVGRQEMRNYVREALKGLKPDVPTDPVIVAPAGCKAGPEVRKVSDATSTSLRAQFHGDNVTKLLAEILTLGDATIARDTIKPESANITVRYDVIAPGTYWLRLSGLNCTGTHRMQFTIPDRSTGGVVKPVPDPDPPVITPPVVLPPATSSALISLARGMDDHLKLVFRDSADVRIMSDLAPDNRFDKDRYLYRYLINADLVDSDTRLKNYVVAGNNPLRVLVGKLKRDYKAEGFNKWAGTPEEIASEWYKLDAGEPFSFNTSYAFHTFVSKSTQTGTGFLNPVPANYDPSDQQVSWGAIGEDIQLPKGHFWGASWYPWGVDKVFAKGVTHLAHHSLPWDVASNDKLAKELKAAGKTFSNYQRIEAVFGRGNNGSTEKWPNGTSKAVWPTADGLPADEAREWAWKTDASDAIWLSEMSENVGWQPGGSPMFAHFYPELRKRYKQTFGDRGIPYEIIHNYFWLGGESLGHNRSTEYYKQLFRTDPKDLPQTEFSPGAPLSSTTMIVEAVYLNAPDLVLRQPTQLAFRLEYFKQMGYHAGVVLFGVHETRPNNRYRIDFPDGTFYKGDKAPLDPNVHIASLFFGHVYGNATFEWGASGWANQKLFDGRPGQPLDFNWFPTGSKEPRNDQFNKFWNGSGDFYGGFNGSADLTYFAHRLFAKTFGATDGGDRAYLRFRIDGGRWINPGNYKADELIDAYKEQRGFVYSQTLAGKTGWFYHNSFADNNWHTIDVQLPSGRIVSEKVAGNGIHAKLENQ